MSTLRIGLVLLIFPMAILLGGYFSELSLVNECLREQGSFDYSRQVCDFSQNHPFISYFQRHTSWVNGAMLISVLGLILCAIGLYQKKR
ncbi:hypothetical protein [Motiliproteus sp. MSK22-1]|uniref:hypothetical protein n=1 Tax=Motiliproteus sp. MSK22-1 TaxID=1897630 RepID=UPI0009784213|nr:hypothetical protein [Motiliproteus sp. MSK22-1]OMH28044.1 hypothetical protein BGP75_21995 [Motiliproteus sp. MSK22-1]